jgi:hypothetical protein
MNLGLRSNRTTAAAEVSQPHGIAFIDVDRVRLRIVAGQRPLRHSPVAGSYRPT